ncbi:MAG: phosphoribosylanthranilate isomerase [Gemmatimonadetes bacterium]|nr:phosphoribosylanthranilate isomerase [Gemmatimonadota bacterium]
MRTRVKICCISSRAEADLAIRAGADCLGLVGEMPSGPGPISDEAIREIAAAAPPGVATFLLTSRTDPSSVVEHVRLTGTNVVQLVDSVPTETYHALRAECPSVRIVQVVHVEDEGAVELARSLSSNVDGILLDSGRPNAAVKELGGTGRTHDWKISKRVVDLVSVPVFLAGGLAGGNARQAIDAVAPFGVDLCSGVRSDVGLDRRLLTSFMAEVRGTDPPPLVI